MSGIKGHSDSSEDITEWSARLQREPEAARGSGAGAGGCGAGGVRSWEALGSLWGDTQLPEELAEGGEACLPPSGTEEESETQRGLVTCPRAPRNDPPLPEASLPRELCISLKEPLGTPPCANLETNWGSSRGLSRRAPGLGEADRLMPMTSRGAGAAALSLRSQHRLVASQPWQALWGPAPPPLTAHGFTGLAPYCPLRASNSAPSGKPSLTPGHVVCHGLEGPLSP